MFGNVNACTPGFIHLSLKEMQTSVPQVLGLDPGLWQVEVKQNNFLPVVHVLQPELQTSNLNFIDPNLIFRITATPSFKKAGQTCQPTQ